MSHQQPGFLQSPLLGAQERRYLETCNRLIIPKQSTDDSIIQNGDSRGNFELCSGRRVADLVRSDRCILPRSHSNAVQEVSSLCGRGSDLSVRCSPLRTLNCPLRLYETGEISSSVCPPERGSRPSVPGRLASTGGGQSVLRDHHSMASVLDDSLGVQGKLHKVRSESRAEKNFPRDFHRFDSIQSFPQQRSCSSLPSGNKAISRQYLPTSYTLAEDYRSSRFAFKNCSPCGRYASSFSEGSHFAVEPRAPPSVPQRENFTRNSECTHVVAERRESPSRSIPQTIFRHDKDIYGCVQSGLGSMPEFTVSPRLMASVRGQAHKCIRDDCCLPRLSGFYRSNKGIGHNHYVRQHDCGLIHKQTGRHEVEPDIPRSGENAHISVQSHGAGQGTSYRRCFEHCRRSPFETEQLPVVDRMVSSPRGSKDDLGQISSTFSGSICDSSEPQINNLRLPLSAPSGMESGRDEFFMGRPRCLRLPPNEDAAAGSGQDSATQLQNPAGSPSVAQANLVCRGSESAVRFSLGTTSTTKTVKATSNSSLPPEPLDLQTPRLAIIKQANLRDGFSVEACSLMADSLRESTLKQYESRWKLYVSWCETNEVSPVDPTIPQLADFLTYLFKERNLLPKSVEVYRSAISRVIKSHSGVDVGHDCHLNQLIDGMYRRKPAVRKMIPSWDLVLVLEALRSAPFEPCNQVSPKFLTLKTVFLTALATGLRRSELHALSRSSISHHPQGEWIQLRTRVGFIAKTQLFRSSEPFRPIRIPALTNILTPDDDDRRLCPVRMLNTYLRRTSQLVPPKHDQLFISFKEGQSNNISLSTISNWVTKTVKTAYSVAGTKNYPSNIKAHDVRAMSASLAVLRNVAMKDILESAQWKSKNTFISFYMKDFSICADGLSSLGPLVVSQTVTKP